MAQQQMRKRGERQANRYAGRRDQQQRREHARNIQAKAGFDDATGEPGALSGRPRRDRDDRRDLHRHGEGKERAFDQAPTRANTMAIATPPTTVAARASKVMESVTTNEPESAPQSLISVTTTRFGAGDMQGGTA